MSRNMLRSCTIRLARRSDIAAILGILQAWPRHFVDAAAPYVAADFHPARALVAIVQGQVVGFVLWQVNAWDAEILWLAVRPDLARRGIATALLERFRAGLKGPEMILVKTATLDSKIPGSKFRGAAFKGTLQFFRSWGFVQIGRAKSYFGPHNHCYIMARTAHGRR